MKSKEKRKERICVIKLKARKTNLFNAMVKEAKVKDFAILFLVLSWFYQCNHKNLVFNISKRTLINFAETFFLQTLFLSVVSHSIIFIKIGTACLSFSRLNFLMYICPWICIGIKNNLMSIFYVALSTCSVVLPICHVVLSTWSVVLSHYGMAPIDLCCLHKYKQINRSKLSHYSLFY